jgi:hypothetical protein
MREISLFKITTMKDTSERVVIHPEDAEEVQVLTRKWGVSRRQIYDAILETGSLKLIDIKKRLRMKGELHFLPGWMYRFEKLF